MLKLKNITKDYKVADSYVHALKGIDLEFRESEFVCILGQSGCGKTTLLNIIGGLDHYTSGDLIIGGKSTKSFKDRDWDVYRNHKIGFIFQSYNLIPHQTVLGNVEIALTIAGVSKEERKERAKQALERVGLGSELNKRPNQLSGGQMQRVAIARALVNNPAILLADEPTGALDSKTSVEVMELIKEIAGERLVIMVTHNPELAESYASRIVRLKDGLVENDTNPYTEEEAAPAAHEETVSQSGKKEKKARTRMSWFTTLALSARNLLTKKARTALTAIGGSIGIISVCLVLALSSGFNAYIKRTEEDMLSYYPVEITESAFDVTSAMMSFTAPKDMPDMSQLEDKVYVDSFLTKLGNNIAVKNNITAAYKHFVESVDDSLYSEIQYGYGVSLVDNLFTTVDTGLTADKIVTKNMSLSALKQFYIAELMSNAADKYGSLVQFADFFGNIINKMPGTMQPGDANYAKYVLSQYDILKGAFPQAANEAVLVVGGNNDVTDLTLAQLGLLSEPKFLSLFDLGKDGEEKPVESNDESEEFLSVSFDEVLNKKYILYFNNEVYSKNTVVSEYPYVYNGVRESLTATDEQGIELKVVGILRLKEGLTYGCLKSGLNITEKVVEDYIDKNADSEIVKYVKANSYQINGGSIYFGAPTKELAAYYTQPIEMPMGGTILASITDTPLRHIAGLKSINSIHIYATDFDGKEGLLSYLDQWNEMCENGETYTYTEDGTEYSVTLSEKDEIKYTDRVGLLMSMMQTMLNAITYVLVAFTAISLVVSSVMIGIITYVSVVERIKEIGVLRSLGARKMDIKNLFNAETFIIGLSAGVFGVIVTYLLSLVINVILNALTGIVGLAALNPVAAVIMIAVSVGLTLISGLIPASAAAKKDPVIALRTE